MMTSQLTARHVTTRPVMGQAPRKTSTTCRAAARPESVPQKAAALAAAAAVLLVSFLGCRRQYSLWVLDPHACR